MSSSSTIATLGSTPDNKPSQGDRIRPYQWKKGQSGNPNGRPKRDPEIDKKLEEYSLPAIERLGKIILDKNTRSADAIKAASLILGYSIGKPIQQVDVSGGVEHGIIIRVSPENAELYAGPEATTLIEAEYSVDDQ